MLTDCIVYLFEKRRRRRKRTKKGRKRKAHIDCFVWARYYTQYFLHIISCDPQG
jgi:hypothetical protein